MGKAIVIHDINFSSRNLGKVTFVSEPDEPIEPDIPIEPEKEKIYVTSKLPGTYTSLAQLSQNCTSATPATKLNGSTWAYRPEYLNGIEVVTAIILPVEYTGTYYFCKLNLGTSVISDIFTIEADGTGEYALSEPINLAANETIGWYRSPEQKFGLKYKVGGSEFVECTTESSFVVRETTVQMPYLIKGYYVASEEDGEENIASN